MHYFKYIIKGFKTNLSRFLAVIAIVALGVGVLVGLLSSPSDLEASMNKYYNEHNLMDLVLKSNIGFSNDALDLISSDDTIIEALYINEANMEYNGDKYNARIISRKMNDNINSLILNEGRFPLYKNECIALSDNTSYLKLRVGDSFVFDGENYIVSGIASSVEFISIEREYNLNGSNKLDFIFYTDSSLNSFDAITDLYIRFKSLSGLDRFKDKYMTNEHLCEEKIKEFNESLIDSRKLEIRSEIKDNVTNSIRLEISKNYPSNLIDSIMESDAVLKQIEDLTNEQFDNFIKENNPEIYYLNLKSNMSYLTFKENTQKVNKIVVVFPVFFFFIAALVSLTTLTRLTEEERGSIGLLKSLGYSKFKISIKYIIYGNVCSIIGAVLGLFLGLYIIPYVIHVAFNSLYIMPKAVFKFNVLVNLFSFLLMVITIFIVTSYVTLRVLNEKPCALLMPKAPRPGKRILLEKIPFIWNKIKFKHKNMLRNIFRYKKNLIMMIIGVGGCVALLLCAFGISDAVGSVGKIEYGEILNYDLKVSISKDNKLDEDDIDEITYAKIDNVYLDLDKSQEYEVKRVIVNEEISKFINFKNGKNKINIKNGDVIITKQLASKFKLKNNDKFTINNEEYTVNGIMDNPIDNYIYIISDEVISHNYCYINTSNQDEVISRLLDLDYVSSFEIKSSLSTSYDAMSSSLTLVVLVIILCSGALAIIVIYNLTNININERFKELATLKVLGYQKNEVCGYIYREVFIMSLMGILIGFIIGPIFFSFIIYNLQSPGLTFSNTISPIYFLYSFILTIIFVILVDLLFIPKISKIKMVESLKCVD